MGVEETTTIKVWVGSGFRIVVVCFHMASDLSSPMSEEALLQVSTGYDIE